MASTNSEADLEAEIGISLGKLQRQLAQAEARFTRTAKKFETDFMKANGRVVRNIKTVDTAARGFAGGGIRQMTMQFSQVAQQGAASGDWLRALAIQLPDLALGFGAAGIAAGALLGALGPMAIDMFTNADATEELEKKLKELSQAIDRVEKAEANLSMSGFDVRERYGGLTEAARRLFEIEKQMAVIRQQAALNDATTSIAEALGIEDAVNFDPGKIAEMGRSIAALREERDKLGQPFEMSDEQFLSAINRVKEINEELRSLEGVEDSLYGLGTALGVTTEEAGEVARLFAEAGAAMKDSPEEAAAAFVQLTSYIADASNNLAGATEEGRSLYDTLLEVAAEALRMSSFLEDGKDAATAISRIDMASAISAAVGPAELLAAKLREAVAAGELLTRLRGLEGGDTSKLNFGFGFGRDRTYGGGVGGDTALRFGDPNAPPLRSVTDLPPASKKGGGGGKSEEEKELNRLLRERDRILGDLETAQEEYNRKLADLNKLQEMGELSTDEYNAALVKLREDLLQAEFGEVIRGIESVSDAIANAIVNGENLGEALGQVFKQIAADLISSGIKNLLMQTFGFGGSGGGGLFGGGGGGGIFGSILGGIFGGGRATGGPVQAGKLYAVNENTPNTEFFQPGVSGRILTPAQAAPLMAGGGGGAQNVHVTVGVSADNNGNLRPFVESVSQRNAAAGAAAAVKTGRDQFGPQLTGWQGRYG